MSGYSVHSRVTRRLFSALALSALALGAVGCSKDSTNSTSTSTTGGSVTPMQCPTGTIVGTIVDNNGAPVSGAQVFIPDGATACGSGSKVLSGKTLKVHGKSVPVKASVTTDAAGQFSIPHVVATNVANSSGSFTGHLPIDLVVVPPAGFLGATVEVSPMAQVVGDLPPFSSDTNPALIFVQGFTASTGLIRIPATTTTIKGVLQNTTTGQPIPNATVDLDFRGFAPDNGGSTPATNPNPGVVVQYNDGGVLFVTTDANGNFSFSGVADDSCFDLSSPGLVLTGSTLDSDSGCESFTPSSNGILVGTQTESAHTVVLGDVSASSLLTGDHTPPYVTKVAQVTNQAANPGPLASGADGTGGIQVFFSETVNVAANPTVIVTESAPPPAVGTPTVVPSTAAFSGGILTVTTSQALTPGALVTIQILAQDVTDLAGNILATGVGNLTTNPIEVAFDSPNGNYVDLNLAAFQPAVTGLTAVTNLKQNSSPVNADGSFGACAESQALFASSDAFLDTSPDTLTGSGCQIAQLNSESTRTFGATSIKGHLTDLENALLGSVPVSLVTELANVSFTTSGAVDYVIEVRDANNLLVNLVAANITVLPVGGQPTASTSGTVVLDPPYGDSAKQGVVLVPTSAAANGGTVNFLIGPVLPGDQVVVVPRGTGGAVSSNVASAASVVLKDNGRPTTGVQILMAAIQAAISSSSGSGGGPVSTVSTSGGEPIFPVTPLAYDRDPSCTGTGCTYATFPEDLNGPREPGGLSNPALAGLIPGTTVYDATGWAAFNPTNALGVAVTEPLSTTATQPAPAYTGTAALSFNQVLNNTYSPADTSTDNDLYVMNVDSVLKLENDGRTNNKDIDLTGIVDASGLAADTASHAKVQVRDVTPPFMTQAYRKADGSALVFVFDEPVNPTAPAVFANSNHIGFLDCGFFIQLPNAFNTTLNPGSKAATLTNGGKTITIPFTNTELAGFPGSSCFGTASYAEPVYGVSTAVNHGQINWLVPDTANNSDIGLGDPVANGANDWAYWANIFAPALGVNIPVFAAADLLGPFTVLAGNNPPICSNFTNGQNNWSCTVRVNQPIFFGKLGGGGNDFNGLNADANSDGKISQTELNAYCATIFMQADNTDTFKAAPTSCNPIDANGALVNPSTPPNFTATDVARIQGLVLNFTGALVATNDRFEFTKPGGPAAAGNFYTLSSAPYASTGFSVTNYGTGTIASTGVVVRDDGVNPQSAFELLPAVAP